MTDKEKFLNQARTYVGRNGDYVCNTKLHLNMIVDWCAFSVCSIMKDCGFVGKYIKEVTGGAGTVPRYSNGKFGTWFKKGTTAPQAGDLFFLRYADYPSQDKYFCDHIGIVESVDGDRLTTLEGNVDGISGSWASTSAFKRKTRWLNDNTVYAFYRPNWQTEQKTTSTTAKKDVEIYQLNSSAKVDFNVKVTAKDGLNIRQGAGTAFSILGTVPNDTIIHIYKRTSGGQYKWGLVEYQNTMGWIALDYTQMLTFQSGDTVTLKDNAVVYNTDTPFDTWAYTARFEILEILGTRAVIGINGRITGAVDIKYLDNV